MEFEGALARALGPFRGNNKWLSRIRVRRVAHAVLWGDGLRFRVRNGRLLSSRAQHTLARSWAPWVDAPAARSSRCVRLRCLGSQCAAANQDISLASDTRASSGGVDSRQRHAHGHMDTYTHTQATTCKGHAQVPVPPVWVELGGVGQGHEGEVWPDDVGLFSQQTTDNKHRHR